jgi:Thioesterase domain/Phosphopantetheine attachment site
MNRTLSESTLDLGYQRPRDPVEIWLARQWQHILGFTVGIRENFFGVGGNSLDAARMVDAIRVAFGVELPLNAVNGHPTVERLATVLRGRTERLSRPLVAIEDGDGLRPPLFLVHPDDGQVEPYCRLAHGLGEQYAVFGLQAVGLHCAAQPHRTVAAMADAYVEAVRTVSPTGPYLLGGCGVGTAIVYEMAARLEDVQLAAAIDGALLDLPDPGAASSVPDVPGPADLGLVLTDWQERGLVPPNPAPEFVGRSLAVRRANREALRDWRPSQYAGPIDVFGDASLPPLPAAAVARSRPCDTDEDLVSALRELIG